MVINKRLKIIRETIFDSLVTLNKKTNDGIKKRNKAIDEKSCPFLNGQIDREANLDIA